MRIPLVLLLALAGATPAAAAVIEVETLVIVDGGTFPPCELDEAILSANDDFAVGGCSKGNGADVIVFDVEGTIELPAELPTIEEDLTIRGPGADQLTLDAEQVGRILRVAPGVTLTLEGVTLANGAVPAGNGGALLLDPGSTVVLRDCRITGSQAANGGGVYANEAQLRIERCLLDGNEASAQGGALYARDADVELVNTTLSGNAAQEGGGLAVVDAGDPGLVTLHSVTLAENEADEGGQLLVTGDAEVQLRHTLLAEAAAGGNCAGAVTSLDYNLSDDDSCALDGEHDLEEVEAGLGPLADHGGPTPLHALLAGSVAIDAGAVRCRDAQEVILDTDQRGEGFPRVTDGDDVPGWACDIGAYEAAPEPAAAAGATAALAALAALARARRHRLPSRA